MCINYRFKIGSKSNIFFVRWISHSKWKNVPFRAITSSLKGLKCLLVNFHKLSNLVPLMKATSFTRYVLVYNSIISRECVIRNYYSSYWHFILHTYLSAYWSFILFCMAIPWNVHIMYVPGIYSCIIFIGSAIIVLYFTDGTFILDFTGTINHQFVR